MCKLRERSETKEGSGLPRLQSQSNWRKLQKSLDLNAEGLLITKKLSKRKWAPRSPFLQYLSTIFLLKHHLNWQSEEPQTDPCLV